MQTNQPGLYLRVVKENTEGLAGGPASGSSSESGVAPNGSRASHLQMGHSGLREDSHWSMHSRWKRCLQGSTRSFSPSLRTLHCNKERGKQLLPAVNLHAPCDADLCALQVGLVLPGQHLSPSLLMTVQMSTLRYYMKTCST